MDNVSMVRMMVNGRGDEAHISFHTYAVPYVQDTLREKLTPLYLTLHLVDYLFCGRTS